MVVAILIELADVYLPSLIMSELFVTDPCIERCLFFGLIMGVNLRNSVSSLSQLVWCESHAVACSGCGNRQSCWTDTSDNEWTRLAKFTVASEVSGE